MTGTIGVRRLLRDVIGHLRVCTHWTASRAQRASSTILLLTLCYESADLNVLQASSHSSVSSPVTTRPRNMETRRPSCPMLKVWRLSESSLSMPRPIPVSASQVPTTSARVCSDHRVMLSRSGRVANIYSSEGTNTEMGLERSCHDTPQEQQCSSQSAVEATLGGC